MSDAALPGRSAFPSILIVIFVDTLGYAAVVPLIPFALRGQHAPLLAVGTVFAAFSLCQLITAPLLGRLSDKIGRRPVLAFSLGGSVIGFALLAISSAFPIVLLSRIIDGGSAGNVAMCYAMALDSSADESRRSRGIAALGATSGAGLVAGLGFSAFLAGYGFSVVALAAMLLSLLSLVLTLTIIPETRRRSSPNFKITTALRLREIRRAVLFVGLCAALQAAFLLALPVYFASALGLHAQATTALIMLLVVVAAIFQLGALPRLLDTLGAQVTAGLLLAVALCSAVAVGIISKGAVGIVLASALLTVAVAALSPISTLLLSQSHPHAPVGLTMGLNSSAATVGQIVGPIIGYGAFAVGGSRGLGLGSVALTFCTAGALGAMRIRARLKRIRPGQADAKDENDA